MFAFRSTLSLLCTGSYSSPQRLIDLNQTEYANLSHITEYARLPPSFLERRTICEDWKKRKEEEGRNDDPCFHTLVSHLNLGLFRKEIHSPISFTPLRAHGCAPPHTHIHTHIHSLRTHKHFFDARVCLNTAHSRSPPPPPHSEARQT